MLLIAGGRWIRQEMLISPDGAWRDDLWLEGFLPAAPEAETTRPSAPPRLTAPLDINSCSVDSLTLLPRVGPVLARRIDEQRRLGVVFHSPDDLQVVPGIGPVLADRLDTLLLYASPRE